MQVEVDWAEVDPESREWLHAAADDLRELSKDSFLDAYLADRNSIQRDVDQTIQDDAIFVELGFVVVLCVACAYLFRPCRVRIKSHLAIASMVASETSLARTLHTSCVGQLFSPCFQLSALDRHLALR